MSNDLKGTLKNKDHTFSQKAELQTEGHEPGSQLTLKGNAKEFELGYEWAPKELQPSVGQAGLEFQLKHGNDQSLETELELKAGGYDLGGVIPWSSLQVKAMRGNAASAVDGKQPWTFESKWTESFKYDDWFVGFKCNIDAETATNADRKYPYLKSAYALIAHQGALGNFWMRSMCLENHVAFGASHKLDDGTQVTAEVVGNIKNKLADVMHPSLPLHLRFAIQKTLSNKVKYHNITNVGVDITSKDKLEFPLKDNLKATVTCHSDVKQMFSSPFDSIKGFGLTVDYKL